MTRKKSEGARDPKGETNGASAGSSRGAGGRGRRPGDGDRGKQARAREIAREARAAQREDQAAVRGAQRELHAAQRETQAAMREATRDAQAALREAQRETQAAMRQAQREVAGQEGAGSKRGSKLKRAAATVGQAAAKVDAALAAEADKQERLAKRSAEQAAKLDRLAGYLGALDVWTRVEPGTRKPRFSREEIAAVAIRIADEEGLDALSMRHLASELGAGTMTLYHYVRTKDELMTLVNDAIMGEVVVPADQPIPDDWRAALTLIANRSRDTMRRHPWVLDISDDPPFGPNGVRHFDQTLQAVASLDLELRDRLDIAGVVDEYVFGYCLAERNDLGSGEEVFSTEVQEYVGSLLATGDYPQIQAIADDVGLDAAWAQIGAHLRDPARFDRGLERILDGIEASLRDR